MIDQLHKDAPWMAGRIEQLQGEHRPLLASAEALVAHCRAGTDAEIVRDEALELLKAVSRHRQRGTDLLYEAYMVDLSAGD
jgi:hypothetical protein